MKLKVNNFAFTIIIGLQVFSSFAGDKLQFNNGIIKISTTGTALLGSGLTEFEAKTLAIEDAKGLL